MKFDFVFDETCRNEDVYNEAVKPLVTLVFDKYVCLTAVATSICRPSALAQY